MKIIKSVVKTQQRGLSNRNSQNRALLTDKGYLSISPVALKDLGVPAKADVFVSMHLMEDSKGEHVMIALDQDNGFKMYRPTDNSAALWVTNARFAEFPAGEYRIDTTPKKIGKGVFYKLVDFK